MRMAIIVALFAAASFLAPGSASAVPLALGDQAALARDASAASVEPVARRYTRSVRHTIQVDFHPYSIELQRERKRGRKRPKRPLAGPPSISCNASPSPVVPVITAGS
jgi:hypothetical protein